MPRPAQAAVVDAVYATVSRPERWPATLELIADHIGASGGMLAYQDLVGSQAFLKVARLRDDLTDLYLRHYTHNPYALAMTRTPPGRTTFANELVEHRVMRRTPMYADILAPQRIDDMVLIGHPALTSASTSGGISFTLDSRQVETRGAVRDRFQRLAPHLVRSIDLSLEVGRKAEAVRGLETLLAVLPGPALLIDGRARVLQANDDAEALLAEKAGLTIGPDRCLVAARAHDNRELSGMLRDAILVASGQEGPTPRAALRIAKAFGPSVLIVTATPLPAQARAPWESFDSGARVLVRIVDPELPLDRQAGLLKEAVGLTATEARVASLIAQGRTAPEVGAILGLSPATVRTHLARCFDKTGSRSQVALARLLTSL